MSVFSGLICKEFIFEPSMVAHDCNLSPQEAEVGGSSVQGMPGLHSKTQSQKKKDFFSQTF
jgi:hypothetical protein